MTTVALVIPARDGGQFLLDCMSAALHGDGLRSSVVVIDSASTDGSIDLRGTCLIDHSPGVIVRPNVPPLSLPVSSYRRLAFDQLADHYQHLLRTLGYESTLEFVMKSPA